MDIEAQRRVIDAFIENVCELTPEELRAELIEEGIDPAEYAREGLEIMLRGVENHYVRLRLEDELRLEQRHQRSSSFSSVPGVNELLAAIGEILARFPAQQQLTLCHRDLKAMTAEDLRLTLEALQELIAARDNGTVQ